MRTAPFSWPAGPILFSLALHTCRTSITQYAIIIGVVRAKIVVAASDSFDISELGKEILDHILSIRPASDLLPDCVCGAFFELPSSLNLFSPFTNLTSGCLMFVRILWPRIVLPLKLFRLCRSVILIQSLTVRHFASLSYVPWCYLSSRVVFSLTNHGRWYLLIHPSPFLLSFQRKYLATPLIHIWNKPHHTVPIRLFTIRIAE